MFAFVNIKRFRPASKVLNSTCFKLLMECKKIIVGSVGGKKTEYKMQFICVIRQGGEKRIYFAKCAIIAIINEEHEKKNQGVQCNIGVFCNNITWT
jgi:hypothetical protein